MAIYNVKNNEDSVRHLQERAGWKNARRRRPMRTRDRVLIKFLALIIPVRMQIIVSKSKVKNLTVKNVLMSSSTYKIVKNRGVNVHSEKT